MHVVRPKQVSPKDGGLGPEGSELLSLSGSRRSALGWECSRQAEVREDANLEAGDCADALTRERHDKETERAIKVGAGVASVHRERGLAIGSGRREAAVVIDDSDVGEEAGTLVETAVLERKRWHAQAHVVGEQRDEAVNVVALEGRGESFDQLGLDL